MNNNTALYAMQFYMKRGYSPVAAAGIVGNLDHESNLNTRANGDGGQATGIAQWHPDRWAKLTSWANKNGMDPRSLDTQLGYVDVELRSMPNAFAQVSNAQSVKQSSGAFALHFERPKGAETGVVENIHGWGSRLGRAVNFASLATGKPMADFAASGWTPPAGGAPGGAAAGGDTSFELGPAPDAQLPQVDTTPYQVSDSSGGGSDTGDLGDPYSGFGGEPMDTENLEDPVSTKYAQTAQYRKMGLAQSPTEMSVSDLFGPQNVSLQKIGSAANAPAMRKMSVG